MSLNNSWELVKDFHIKFGHPVSEEPILLDPQRVKNRYKWMLEELDEFIESKDIYEQSDAMIDLIYFAFGTLVEMGVRPSKLFEVVHSANMSKLWDDGKPHYNEDGKTIKPVGWKDPLHEIIKEISYQRNNCNCMNYENVIAKPFLCVAAVLESIVNTVSYKRILQEEIGEFFGLFVPEDYAGDIKNIIKTNDSSKWGICIKNDDINSFFKSFNIPLKEEFIPISRLTECEFEYEVKRLLKNGSNLICGYNYSYIYNRNNMNDIGHVSIITNIEDEGYLTLLDPGPDEPGYKRIKTKIVYNAIKSKWDGLWVIT